MCRQLHLLLCSFHFNLRAELRWQEVKGILRYWCRKCLAMEWDSSSSSCEKGVGWQAIFSASC